MCMQLLQTLAQYGVRDRLMNRWKAVHQQDSRKQSKAPAEGFQSAQQQQLFGLCSSYKDVLLPARQYASRCACMCS